MSKRVFITGGAGFIGSYLARQWAESGAQVCVYDNFHPQAHAGTPDSEARLKAAGVEVIRGDIRDGTALSTALIRMSPDLVYHLAAETGTGQSFDIPAHYSDVNVTGTAHLIEAIRKHAPNMKRIVLAGTRAVYGEGACIDKDGRPTPALSRCADAMADGDFELRDKAGQRLVAVPSNADWPVAPASIYASTKLMQEYLLRQGFWGTDVEVAILRLQNVYGPGQAPNNPYTGVLSIFASQIREGKILDIFEDGKITRDFVFIDDVVAAFMETGKTDRYGEAILDIGTGQGATILAVAQQLLRLLGAPVNQLEVSGRFRPGDIRHAVADLSHTCEMLEWRPKHTLESGLVGFVNWLDQLETA